MLLLLTACSVLVGPSVDQCLRAELTQTCLEKVPAGPSTVTFNDWAEVVNACAQMAYYQAIRQPAVIRPECLAK